jgi:hypothetical protein
MSDERIPEGVYIRDEASPEPFIAPSRFDYGPLKCHCGALLAWVDPCPYEMCSRCGNFAWRCACHPRAGRGEGQVGHPRRLRGVLP